MVSDKLTLLKITALDSQIAPLVTKAQGEGHRFMQRLRDDWQSGANRFDAAGEILLGAYAAGRLMAVGGLNRDPYAADNATGRLRHVYVLAAARRSGVGTLLVNRITAEAARSFAVLRLRTMTAEAAAFYERLGFRKISEDSATHSLDLREYVKTPSPSGGGLGSAIPHPHC